jgi:hypothetical protein
MMNHKCGYYIFFCKAGSVVYKTVMRREDEGTR